jgi:hypothetical protein
MACRLMIFLRLKNCKYCKHATKDGVSVAYAERVSSITCVSLARVPALPAKRMSIAPYKLLVSILSVRGLWSLRRGQPQ